MTAPPSDPHAPVDPSAAADRNTGPRAAVATLERREDLGSGYHRLVFRSDQPVEGRAGHFGMIRSEAWGHAPLLPRPMSLLSVGERPSMLIKAVGDGTRRMAMAPLGERFALLAPLGTPWRRPPPEVVPILVAGGVGLPPLLLLARELAARASHAGEARPRPIALYGGRTDADLPLAEELGESCDLRLATDDGSCGAHGLVTTLLPAAIADGRARGAEVAIYGCGPQGMLRAVAAIAADHQADCQVSLEALMGCGYGVCLGCPTPRAGGGYLYTCTEGPCVDARVVDWTETRP